MVRLMSRRLILGGAVTALTLSACGGSTTASSGGAATSATPAASTGVTATGGGNSSSAGSDTADANGWTGAKLDACSLLTPAQATTAGGREIVGSEPGPSRPNSPSICLFDYVNSFGHRVPAFTLSVVYPTAQVRATVTPTQFMDTRGPDYKPVSGIGDQAVEATNDKGPGFWQGRRGGTVLLVGATGGVSRTQGEALLQAALTAVG